MFCTRAITTTVCLILFAGASSPLYADTSLTPRSAVLVLNNGEVLRGHVTREGDRYVMTLGSNGEIRIPKERVEMLCLSMDEAYQRKRAAQHGTGIDGHLKLAEWCLRQSLTSQAADELLSAMAIDPDDHRIPLLERRLRLAVNRPLPPVVANHAKPATVSLDTMEKAIRALPEGVVADFTAYVQPLLLNRCGATACHGASSESAYRLVRPAWGKTVPRRFTQRNLFATLCQINMADPDESPVVTKPNSAHGDMPIGIFDKREMHQYDLLVEWVRQAAKQRPAPQKIVTPTANLAQATFAPTAEDHTLVQSAAFHEAVDTRPGQEAPSQRTSAVDKANVLPDSGYTPKDPFDPEIFNRRFHRAESGR